MNEKTIRCKDGGINIAERSHTYQEWEYKNPYLVAMAIAQDMFSDFL